MMESLFLLLVKIEFTNNSLDFLLKSKSVYFFLLYFFRYESIRIVYTVYSPLHYHQSLDFLQRIFFPFGHDPMTSLKPVGRIFLQRNIMRLMFPRGTHRPSIERTDFQYLLLYYKDLSTYSLTENIVSLYSDLCFLNKYDTLIFHDESKDESEKLRSIILS